MSTSLRSLVSELVNRARAAANGLLLGARYSGARGLKLHLGCGERRLAGFLNIDRRKTPAVDLVLDIACLPFGDASVSRIESYHVIEHIPRNLLRGTLAEWFRVLEPGGVLVLELPDFDAAVREYLGGNDGRLDSIYGLQRFPGDTHFFGYNHKRLQAALTEAGFSKAVPKTPQDYHAASEPCIRVECRK